MYAKSFTELLHLCQATVSITLEDFNARRKVLSCFWNEMMILASRQQNFISVNEF